MRDQPRFGFARKPMPAKCPDCGLKMSEVKYDNKPWSDSSRFQGSARSTRHYRSCGCGCLLVWGYAPEQLPKLVPAFVREHILPVMNFRETVQIVEK
jgi:hypothetical protein